MPEAVAERPVVKEQPQASNGLMLHIANGEFDVSKTATLAKNPTEISAKTFDALQNHHSNARNKQQEELYDRMKKQAAADPEFHGELTPEQLRHSHFIAWARVESVRIGALFRQQKDNPAGQEAVKNALGKLHIIIDDNTSPSELPDQFYNASAQEEGAFYKEFCTGNSNQKLVETLSQQDMAVLKDFLTDMLGSNLAYNALVATKQTHDAIGTKRDFASGGSSIAIGEQPLLDFFRNGAAGLHTPLPAEKASPSETDNVKKRKKEVFESEATTNPDAHKKLMGEMVAVLEDEKQKGRGHLGTTIEETAQGPHGKEIIRDGYVVYIPAVPGERIVTIGDIHGDLATVEQILEKEHFFEDMESGNPKIRLVFQGDLVDRGPKSVAVMTALMKLKTLYKDRVHIIAADHDTTSSGVSPHDFPAKLVQGFGQAGSEIYQQYAQVFGDMPKMVVTGNGIVMVHGGPAAESLNLAQIGRLEDTDTNGIMAEQFSWSDPLAHPDQQLETAKTQALQTYEYVAQWAATQPNLTDESVIKMPGPGNVNLKLHDVKQALTLLKNLPDGEYPNINRVGSGLAIDALMQGILYYDRRAFDAFMQRIGGKVMVRGHQTSNDVDGGKPNLFDDTLWTIHSTGTGSPDSAYTGREAHPSYATFDLGSNIDSIATSNIKSVW